MKPLTIELTKGASRQLQSIGWKTPKGNECRRQFFALAQDGKALVVTPKPAMPQFYDPCEKSPAVFAGEPFPEVVCVEISSCRLLAPPCYQSPEDFENQLPCHRTFEPWKWIYLQTHNQALILEPGDDGPLQGRLDKWLAAMRAAYEHESRVLRAEIERQKTKPLAELGYENEEQREKRVLELRAVLENIVESETPIDNAICKGRLKLTLADVKQGCEGIRDAWLHEDWAKNQGEDLGKMFRERLYFLKWLEKHTGTSANIFDLTTRERRHEISPPGYTGTQQACSPIFPADDLDDDELAPRVKGMISRIVRDTVIVRQVKALHGHTCQLCGLRLELTPSFYYSEAHHLKPLGKPHSGPDKKGNLLCVCPNCHVKLDFAAIKIDLVKLRQEAGHVVERKFIDYHNRLCS